jgi:hypothetical protein
MPLSRSLSVWLLGLVSLSGCYTTGDRINQEVAACCNRHYAMMAWCQCRGEYAECQDYLCDFGYGFRQGYADVAGGADGCPPALPPRKYWGVCYQSPEGRCAIAAWFDGYQHGAAVAFSDGAGSYGRVPTSDEIYRKNCRVPVAIDLEQYKDSHSPPGPPVHMDGDVPPIPEPDPVDALGPTNIPDPYSPGVKPMPPEELGPNAALDATELPSL